MLVALGDTIVRRSCPGFPVAGGSMDNFSLHDLDDDDDVEANRGAAASSSSPSHTPAARNGGTPDPVAEAPKAELLKDVPRSDATQ